MTISTKNVLISEEDLHGVTSVLRSLDLSGEGASVERYESELCRYFSTEFALACNSGTSAIYLSLIAFDVRAGDDVLVSAAAPVMSALPIVALGARPIFIDVESNQSFAPSLDDILKKLTTRTKAVISVPMWGYPISSALYTDITNKTGLPIIDDCAQAHGTKTDVSFQGTASAISTFSTHERKLVSTGEGGFILTNRFDLFEAVYAARAFGKARHNTNCGAFGERFGMNFKLAAPLAELGRNQLRRLDYRLSIRRDNAIKLKNALTQFENYIEPVVSPGSTPNYYAFALVDKSRNSTAKKLNAALNDKQILSDAFRYKYAPTYSAPLFRPYESECPNAVELCSRVVTLPVHEGFNDLWFSKIVSVFSEYA